MLDTEHPHDPAERVRRQLLHHTPHPSHHAFELCPTPVNPANTRSLGLVAATVTQSVRKCSSAFDLFSSRGLLSQLLKQAASAAPLLVVSSRGVLGSAPPCAQQRVPPQITTRKPQVVYPSCESEPLDRIRVVRKSASECARRIVTLNHN